MKSILLPTDFSNNSINAIHYAVQLLKAIRCDFYILNVQKASSFISDDLISVSPSTTIYQTIIDTAKKSIDNLIKSLQHEYANEKHTFHSVVDYDNFVDSINQQCDLFDIDLIVMGTKGASGLEKIIFGSNAMRVIQRCTKPVLAVPEGSQYRGLDTIAFTSNYLTKYNREELLPLLNLAEWFKSKIDILHVMEEDHLSEDQQNNKASLDECLRFVNHEFTHLEKQDIFSAVNDFIKTNDIQLLAMTNRHHSFLERLFTTHNVERFGYHLTIPFLIMEHCAES